MSCLSCQQTHTRLRSVLISHGQHDLLAYFDEHYFPEERIKQWATWYRYDMYGCKWILNSNNHVESWHNILKTYILKRKVNVRVDNLIHHLIRAAKIYIWKWLRCKSGWKVHTDPGTIAHTMTTSCTHHANTI